MLVIVEIADLHDDPLALRYVVCQRLHDFGWRRLTDELVPQHIPQPLAIAMLPYLLHGARDFTGNQLRLRTINGGYRLVDFFMQFVARKISQINDNRRRNSEIGEATFRGVASERYGTGKSIFHGV